MRCLPLIAALIPAMMSAQDIPPYVPANPLLASRSALYVQPFVLPQPGWRIQVVADYYNAIEVSRSSGTTPRQSIFDAEVLQADVWFTRDISPKLFVIADIPVRGGYSGGLDGALNWYHDLIGLHVPAREQQPENVFDWTFVLPDSTVTRTRPGTFIGDVRAGIGMRLGKRAQLVGTLTLPTATLDNDGWSRHTIGTSLSLNVEPVRSSRFVVDAGIGVGVTPTHGALSRYQRSSFASASMGARWRFAGSQAVYVTAWTQSSNWKDTGFTGFDDAETSLDFGFLLRLKRQWPELLLGMTQDLAPHGPAMDVSFNVGLRW